MPAGCRLRSAVRPSRDSPFPPCTGRKVHGFSDHASAGPPLQRSRGAGGVFLMRRTHGSAGRAQKRRRSANWSHRGSIAGDCRERFGHEYESAARSLREGMPEMFTIQRLKLPPSSQPGRVMLADRQLKVPRSRLVGRQVPTRTVVHRLPDTPGGARHCAGSGTMILPLSSFTTSVFPHWGTLALSAHRNFHDVMSTSRMCKPAARQRRI